MIARPAIAFLLLSAACSSGTTASNTSIVGTVAGASYAMQYAIAASFQNADGSSELVLVFTSNPDYCELANGDRTLHQTQLTYVSLGIVDSHGLVLAPDLGGEYDITQPSIEPGSKLAAAETLDIDACAPSVTNASSGQVKITHLALDGVGTPQLVVGSLELDYANGESLTGDFEAQGCPGTFQVLFYLCDPGRSPAPR